MVLFPGRWRMRKSAVFLMILCCGLVFAANGFGQTRVLSLEEALDIAIDVSTTVGIYE